MGTLLGMLKKKIVNLEGYMYELKANQNITEDDISRLKELKEDVNTPFKRIKDKWDFLIEAEEFKDFEERNKCEADYDEAEKIHDSC